MRLFRAKEGGLAKQFEKQAILIAGPTASGKSALALRLASATDGVIVNADAMQVYSDLSILTARPGPDDERRCEHLLFGHVDGAERYSVGKWLEDVEAVLQDVWARDVPAIIVGGTGLYFKALEEGLNRVPEISPERRAGISDELEASGIETLYRRLREHDPEGAALLEPGDVQRVVRALEVVEETGTPLGMWQKRRVKPLLDGVEVKRGHIGVGREVLYQQCNDRFQAMIGNGALAEVTRLRERNLAPQLPVMKAIGVPEFSAYLDGETSLEDAIAAAQMQTRRYAKRQMTWFRGQMNGWPSGTHAEILTQVLK